MNVSFAVQAHPERALLARALADRIGGPVDVVMDPDPDSRVRSPWRTFRTLLEATPPEATHRLQIQDDAAVCDGFRAAVGRAVAARPDRLLVFFVGRNAHWHSQAVLAACRRDEPWAELGRASHAHWVPVVCTCWPAALIPQLTAYAAAEAWPEAFCSDDEVVRRFCNEFHHTPLASVPSLVEHPDVAPTLKRVRNLADRNRNRVAACYVGECGDCVEAIDWTAGPR